MKRLSARANRGNEPERYVSGALGALLPGVASLRLCHTTKVGEDKDAVAISNMDGVVAIAGNNLFKFAPRLGTSAGRGGLEERGPVFCVRRYGRSRHVERGDRMSTARDAEKLAAPFRHRLRVRYGECDSQGVVFNVHYFAYFDVAMTEFHRELLGPYSEMVEAGAEMVVGEARARYLAPARFDEELDVYVDLAHLGNTSMTVSLLVLREDSLLVEGELRYVFIDPRTKHKRPIPKEIREALSRHSTGSGRFEDEAGKAS
jgi:acyl-CoA thioester hydrolase